MRTFPPWAEASAAARRTAVRTQGQRPQVRPLCSAGRGRRGRRSWLPASRLAHLCSCSHAGTQPRPAPYRGASRSGHCHSSQQPPVRAAGGGLPWRLRSQRVAGAGATETGAPHQEEQGCGVGARWAWTAAPALSASALSSGQSCALGGEGWRDPPHGSRRHPAHAAVRARRSFPPRSARRRGLRTGGTGQPPAGSIIRTCDGLTGGGAAARGGDGGRGGVTVARRTDHGWRSGTCPRVFEEGEARGCPFLDLAVALSFLARLLLIFL